MDGAEVRAFGVASLAAEACQHLVNGAELFVGCSSFVVAVFSSVFLLFSAAVLLWRALSVKVT